MSQLNIATLANLAGSETTPIADVINGSARAWVNFSGQGTVTIRASYNVSSITDNGVGDYTVNFTAAMPTVDFCAVITKLNASANNDSCVNELFSDRTVNSAHILTIENIANADSQNINVAIHGN